MRIWTLGWGVAVAGLLVCGTGWAQSGGDGPGMLVVWIVGPGPAAARGEVLPVPEYQEQTAGSFGTPSSNVGQTAGSYGQTAGSVGQVSSSTGTTAGSTGQTAGSFGTESSNVGQTAGSYGQTAGSFGTPSGNVESGQLSGGLGKKVPAKVSFWRTDVVGRDPDYQRWRTFVGEVQRAAKGEVDLEYIRAADVAKQMAVDARTAAAPDVLVTLSAGGLTGLRLEPTMAGTGRIAQTEAGADEVRRGAKVYLVPGARHAEAARRLVVLLEDGDACTDCRGERVRGAAPVVVAAHAMQSLISGTALGGDADAAMAKFAAEGARQRLVGSVGAGGGEVAAGTVEVTAYWGGTKLAVVWLRAAIEGSGGFGVARGVFVLRPDEAGRWRVLQVTENLDRAQMENVYRTLATEGGTTSGVPLGIAQAAPVDGDNRPPETELWWDNLGGATLQVVEWQRCAGESCGPSDLYFVPDNNARARTRVVARFAAEVGGYKWRVWSVGGGGAMVLSGWRRLNVVR